MTTYNDPILHTGTYTPKVPTVATIMAPVPNVPRLKIDGTGYDWNELNRWLQSIQNLLGSSQGQLNNLYNIVNSLSDTVANLILDFSETSSPTFYTVKLTSLSSGRVPYHVSDTVGLADSPIRISTTRVGIGVNPNNTFQVSNLINFNNTLYSTFLGYEAGIATTVIGYNVFIGYGAGKTNISGIYNTAVGYLALNLSSSHYNTAIGYKAGAAATGTSNVLIGDSAGILIEGASQNTAIGSQSQMAISGRTNTSVGFQSLKSNTGTYNTAVGAISGTSLVNTTLNVCIGYSSGNSGGDNNTYIGANSGGSGGTGSSCISIGYYAGFRETASNTLLIDNQLRATEALGRTNGIIYGIMAALPANQYLTFNANVTATGTLTMTGGITVPTLKVTTGAALGSILVSDADGDLTYTAVGGAGTYLAGSATVPTYATLNQAAVAGLTTADGPTFAHLHISDKAAVQTIAESWVGPSTTDGIYFKGGYVGIGHNNPTSKLHYQNTITDPVANVTGPNFTQIFAATAGDVAVNEDATVFYAYGKSSTAKNHALIRALIGGSFNNGDGLITMLEGLDFSGGILSTGNVTDLISAKVGTYSTGTGKITGNIEGLRVNALDAYSVDVTTSMYGINILDMTAVAGATKVGLTIGNISGASSNNYSIYTGTATSYFGGSIGIGVTAPLTKLEVQDGLTTVGAVLTLSSKETSTVKDDILGRINFRAALDASGSDAILTGASIAAIAENTFSATNNETGLQFSTGASEAAVERMRIDHLGERIYETYVVKKVITKTGIADNTATSFARITTVDEAGNTDGGGYAVFVKGLVGHSVSSANAAPAAKSFSATFARVMEKTGTGVNSAVSEIIESASAAVGAATRDLTTVTLTVLETSEYLNDLQILIDLTGTTVQTGQVIFEITLIWYGFLTAPTITAL